MSADHNLNLDEYDDDADDETYYDVDNDEEEDEEVLSHDEEEGNDDDEEEMVVHRPPVADDDEEDDDDDGDEMGGQAVEPVDLGQPPDNPPGKIAGVGVADQGEEHEVHICPEVPRMNKEELEIPGVNKEETEPEIPGVEVAEENEAVEDGDDKPTRVEVPVEPPPAPPEADNNSGGRYNLRGGWSRSCWNALESVYVLLFR